ncbi:MAG: response regulator transcription factor [Bacteroidetes bacterium]|nr:response regulator transcription factor [Bacteroidota bacterium]
MNLLVVDDHEYTREGIIRIIADVYQLEKVGRASTFNDGLEVFRSTQWNLIVLDINLVGKSGIDLIHAIREIDPNVPILVLSMVPVSQYARRIFQAGATGYVTKADPADEFLRGVQSVLHGLPFISTSIQQEIPFLLQDAPESDPTKELSERELLVLQRLVEGKTMKEIAEEYKLSPSTINSYRRRIFLKLGVTNRFGLLRYVYEKKMYS